MFIVEEDGPSLTAPTAIMVAVLLCAVLVVGGGLVPNLFVQPALDAIAGL
jgi:hypothetical protein